MGWPTNLHERDIDYLRERAVLPEVASERGYYSSTKKAELKRLRISSGILSDMETGEALVIPRMKVGRYLHDHQIRPASWKEGVEVRKFVFGTKSGNALDAHPRSLGALGDPSVPLFVTEGIVKGDALVGIGATVVSLAGVWSWIGTNGTGGKRALPEWHDVALNDRLVYLVFDSDSLTKVLVHRALSELSDYLLGNGARLQIVRLPSLDGGKSQGVDDFIASGATLDDVIELALDELPDAPVEEERIGRGDPDFTKFSPSDLAEVLDLVRYELRRYVWLPSRHLETAIVLWVGATYVQDQLAVAPYLAITSPAPSCGKTTLLNVLSGVSYRSWLAIQPSSAILFRRLDSERLTLLWDEVDASLKHSENRGDLMAILNAGTMPGATVSRVIDPKKTGPESYKNFSPFGLKALSGIRVTSFLFPATVSRTIGIGLERAPRGEKLETFLETRDHREDDVSRLRDDVASRLEDATENLDLRELRVDRPEDLHEGRPWDLWKPLISIATAAGQAWLAEAVDATLHLEGIRDKGYDLGIIALSDVREIFYERNVNVLYGDDLVLALEQLDGAEWSEEWKRVGTLQGKRTKLGNVLGSFGIKAKKVGPKSDQRRGYERDQFRSAWAQYLDPEGPADHQDRSASVDIPTTAETKGGYPGYIVTGQGFQPDHKGGYQGSVSTLENSRKPLVPLDVTTVSTLDIQGSVRKGEGVTIPEAREIQIDGLPGGATGTYLAGSEISSATISGPIVALDTETNGAWHFGDNLDLRLVQLGTPDQAVVLDAHSPEAREYVLDLIETGTTFVVWRSSYDVPIIARWLGIDVEKIQFVDLAETSVPELGQKAVAKGLKSVSEIVLDPSYGDPEDELNALFSERGWKRSQKKGKITPEERDAWSMGSSCGWARVETTDPVYLRYAATDAIATAQLYEILHGGGLSEASDREAKVATLLATSAARGMAIETTDVRKLAQSSQEMAVELKQSFSDHWGANPWADGQVRDLLASVDFPLKRLPKTEKKQAPSIKDELLQPYRDEYAVVADLLDARAAKRDKGKPGELASFTDSSGRVHHQIRPQSAHTSRMSSSSPNLQNVTKAMRELFVADPGYSFGAVDYSQIELRVAAAISGETVMRDAFVSGEDIHQTTADALGVSRAAAKGTNFGILYGMGARGLSRRLAVSEQEAADVISRHSDTYQRLWEWKREIQKVAWSHGEIVTPFDRRIEIPRDDEGRVRDYVAINYMIQSSARDLFAEGLARIYDDDLGRYFALPIHDEVLVHAPEDEISEILERVLRAIVPESGEWKPKGSRSLSIPITADISGPSRTWGGCYEVSS